jgi:hypothetical protein
MTTALVRLCLAVPRLRRSLPEKETSPPLSEAYQHLIEMCLTSHDKIRAALENHSLVDEKLKTDGR